MITAVDHIQLAIPRGSEDRVRRFYVDLLGLCEIPKPEPLSGRGGFWVIAGDLQVHFGVDPDFRPATKAHPAFRVKEIDMLAKRLTDAGHPVKWDDALSGTVRFFTSDTVGNRIEFIGA